MPPGYEPDGEDFTLFESEKKARKLIITFGRTFSTAYQVQQALAEEGTDVSILKLNKIMPIHPQAVSYALDFDEIYFYEESMKTGGIGEHFDLLLAKENYKGKFSLSAVDDTFVSPAQVDQQFKEFGLDAESMMRDIKGE